MRSIFGQFSEWLASRSSQRFKLFRSARLIHEAYMKQNSINIENITLEQQKHAIESVELNEAEKLYNKSLELTIADNAMSNLAILYQQLGLLHFMRGEWEQSQKFYTESLSIIENQPHHGTLELDAISTCMLYLAQIALNKGDLFNAKKNIMKSIEIDNSLNNPWSLAMDKRILNRCE